MFLKVVVIVMLIECALVVASGHLWGNIGVLCTVVTGILLNIIILPLLAEVFQDRGF
ncbi:MAG TPA: hypothetical protein VLT90_13040 [Terriglobales bacterium]|nr:hypothetical protein [Terriglobales bacterium]